MIWFVTIANILYKAPTGISFPASKFFMNLSNLSNESSQYEERMEFLRNNCNDKSNPSVSALSNLIQRDKMLNHLGFVLRSQSLFYCSVPKVATRTLLNYITYLHIRDELITSYKSNSTLYFNVSSNPINTDYLNKMLSTTIKVNI